MQEYGDRTLSSLVAESEENHKEFFLALSDAVERYMLLNEHFRKLYEEEHKGMEKKKVDFSKKAKMDVNSYFFTS